MKVRVRNESHYQFEVDELRTHKPAMYQPEQLNLQSHNTKQIWMKEENEKLT